MAKADSADVRVDYARPAADAASRSGRDFRPALWPTLAAAMLIPLFFAAGHWQWNKAALKAERQERLEQRRLEPPVAIPTTAVDPEALEYRRIVARGEYDARHQILIDNRVHDGVAGYHVITPLRLAGSEMRLLVDRGWLPAPADRSALPAAPPPVGEIVVDGTAALPGARFLALGAQREAAREGWSTLWQNLDLDAYRRSVNFPLQPIVLRMAPDSAGGGFVRDWPAPADRRQVNLSYALQWWTFAATTLGLWLYFSWRKKT